jgi:Uma2 family endonuclease
VDPDQQVVEVYTLRGEGYALYGHWRAGERARSRLLEGFEVAVDEILPTERKPHN